MFSDIKGNELEPLKLLGQQCFVRAAVKIESIFLGSGKFTLQVKLYEAQIEVRESAMRSLLSRPQQKQTLLMNTSVMDDVVDEVGSVNDDEEVVEEVVPEPPKITRNSRRAKGPQ